MSHSQAFIPPSPQSRLLPRLLRRSVAALVLMLAGVLSAGAQDFELLHSFHASTGRPNEALVEADGTIYFTTQAGGDFSRGTLNRRDVDGTVTVIHSFTHDEGLAPYGRLAQGTDGALYGVTLGGGPGNYGTIFKWDGALTTLHVFSSVDGSQPRGGLLLGSDGALYGTTQQGGTFNAGTLFRWDGSLTTLHNFQLYTTANGAWPGGTLVREADGTIYGTTGAGGNSGNIGGGTLFRWNGVLTILYRFPLVSWPTGVIKGSDGALYGTTSYGFGRGTIFTWANAQLTTLYTFVGGAGGSEPDGGIVQGTDGAFYGTTYYGGTAGFGTIFKWDGSLTTLHNFDGVDGARPFKGLTQGSEGALYGVAQGQDYGPDRGTLFRIETSGSDYAVLAAFLDEEPGDPFAPHVIDGAGTVYGTTSFGGMHAAGTLFKRTADGTVTVLHSFEDRPVGGVIRGADGALYGLTSGTLYRWDGSFTTLYTFTGSEGYADGNVVQGSDGALYGTTVYGGVGGYGVIFRWDGSFSTVHTFVWESGGYPYGGVTVGHDGALYGTTKYGGDFGNGTIFRWDGTYTALHSFASPYGDKSAVIQGSDGALYGTLEHGGIGAGSIYKWQAGSLTTVYEFGYSGGGVAPLSGVIEGSDGAFYGTTAYGGAAGFGTAFRWDGTLITLHDFTFEDGIYPRYGLTQGPARALYSVTTEGGRGERGTLFRIVPLTLRGPLAPLRLNGEWNVVNGGAVLPIKFEIVHGSGASGDASLIQSFTATGGACSGGGTATLDLLGSGGLQSTGHGRFLFNWKTPKTPGQCYVVTIRLVDGTSASANVRLK